MSLISQVMGVVPLHAVWVACAVAARLVSFRPFQVLKVSTTIYDYLSGRRGGSEADGDESCNSKPQEIILGKMGI